MSQPWSHSIYSPPKIVFLYLLPSSSSAPFVSFDSFSLPVELAPREKRLYYRLYNVVLYELFVLSCKCHLHITNSIYDNKHANGSSSKAFSVPEILEYLTNYTRLSVF